MPKPLPNYREFDLDSLRPFSRIQLIAVDLDGTLLESSNSQLPKAVLELARSLRTIKYGKLRMTIATGRTLTGALPLLEKLPILPDTPIILYNGSLLLNRKYKMIDRSVISAASLQRIIQVSSRFNVKVIAYAYDMFGKAGPNEYALGWSSLDRPMLEHNKMPVKWQDWNIVESAVAPSAIVIHTAGQIKTISSLSSELDEIDDISYTHGGTAYIEVRPQNSNKGVALERAAKEIGLSREQVLAIGDNDNDAEMLSWAGIGVVIESASELAKQSSDYTAHQGIIDGVIEVLKLVRSAKGLPWSITNRARKNKVIATDKSGISAISAYDGESASIVRSSIFVRENDAVDFCSKMLGYSPHDSLLRLGIDLGLLPVYDFEDQKVVLKNDLISLFGLVSEARVSDSVGPRSESLIKQDAIRIGGCTIIDLLHEKFAAAPTFYSATRNLIAEHGRLLKGSPRRELSIPYFSGSRLTTFSQKVFEFAKGQLDREKKADVRATSQLAGSALYLGSKRSLCGFLVESISCSIPESGIVVDLMCGSGVASGAFSKIWRTISSDAQQFCRFLAILYGGGFDRTKAKNLISTILPTFEQHFNHLQGRLADSLETEDKLFCRNTDESLLRDYKHLLTSFPTLSAENNRVDWNPQIEVNRRKGNPSFYPYCLFTTYFSNVYFGLRQSVEIDSLRFAIDQLQDRTEKDWALGALVATVSALGTTYGGHFAQPLVRKGDDITLQNLPSIIDKRSPSVIREFTARLLNLAEQSQSSPRSIQTVPGPWRRALSILDGEIRNEPVVVYVDPPYTREEYSRYYHVLETLVSYTYPSRNGIGLTPKPGERFRSEFFTRVESRMVNTLVSVITNILQRGWSCAWSYSDSGVANIYSVISSVNDEIRCNVKSFCAPFIHISQGRDRKPKKVTEYLIVFSPRR